MGADRAALAKPSREVQQGWAVAALILILEYMVQRSWHHSGFSYFPEEPEETTEE